MNSWVELFMSCKIRHNYANNKLRLGEKEKTGCQSEKSQGKRLFVFSDSRLLVLYGIKIRFFVLF